MSMVSLILKLKLKSLKAQLQYPLNFTMGVLGVASIAGLDVLLILVPATAFDKIGGWGIWQLGFMFSIWKMAHALYQAVFYPFWGHDNLVRTGAYDVLLARPVHPILQILSTGFPVNALGEFIPSLIMLAVTAPKVEVTWGLGNILFLLVIIVSGTIIEWSITLIVAGFSFRFIRTDGLKAMTGVFLERAVQYPIHIYGRIIPFIMTFVFPYAFIAYYPTHHFYGMKVPLYGEALQYLTPGIAAFCFLIGYAFWAWSLRSYGSTGT